MTSTTLTGMYTNTVILGKGSIGDSVTVTGTIAIGSAGGNGIYASDSVSNAYVYNKGGLIVGSTEDAQQGCGIFLRNAGTVNNVDGGRIFGGDGGNYYGGNNGSLGGAGGIGVDLINGGTVENAYLMQGGHGGNGVTGGYGGLGVYIGAAGSVVNLADIFGGAGGNGSQTGGYGGVGIRLEYASLGNSGLIEGGNSGAGGGDAAGVGATLVAYASLSNYGTILGGYEQGLYAGQTGGAGATAVNAYTATKVVNGGVIQGGAGASSPGGTGTAGGVGLFVGDVSVLSNLSTILGGAGGAGEDAGGVGGAGGAGLIIAHAYGKATNSGTITGGAGGAGYTQGGVGGFGVMIEGGATLVNRGVITGGAGGAPESQNGSNGDGGAGVYLNGGTLITSGTIISGGTLTSDLAPAIAFGNVASTLVVEPGAVFNGEVLANDADTLDLAGTAAGTISNLGVEFAGFKTFNVEAHSNWTLAEVDIFDASNAVLNVAGTLTVDDYFDDNTITQIAAGGELQASGSAIILVSDLAPAGGTLNCGAQAEFVIGTTTTGAVKGAIMLDAGATLSGYGTIATALEGSGTLDVTKDVFFIDGVLGPDVTASVAAGSTLDLLGGAVLGASVSGAGTLRLNGTGYTLAGAGAGAKLAIADLVIDSKTTLSGTGTIMGLLANAGTVTASGGQMILAGAVTGKGNFAAVGGATLDIAGGMTTAGALSGAGTIDFASAITLDAGARLDAAQVVDTDAVTLGSGTAVTIAAGEIFSIDAAAGSTITLSGATGDRLSNAGSLAASGPGTADIDVAFVNTKTVSVSSGTLAFLGGVTNNGTLATGAGTLSFEKKISGTGTLGIGTGTLSLLSGAVATQSVRFEQSAGLLDLAHPTDFSGLISDFGAQDKIDLLDTKATGFTFAGGTLTLEDGSKTVASLGFTGSYTQNDFAISTDNHSGTLISFK
jgi:hypothetical protein